MGQDYKYLVATRCFTYKHAPYIKDTLHGFSIQETSYPIVFVIVDDASSDGEPDVLRDWARLNLVVENGDSLWTKQAYGDLAEGRLKEKPNFVFVILLLFENHYSKNKSKFPYIDKWFKAAKYYALCEGDDYWIDPQKLQMQISFMEQHLDYTLCFHSIYEKYEGRPSLNHVRSTVENREYSGVEWYKKRPSQTASFFYRSWVDDSAFYNEIKKDKSFLTGDIPLLLSCAHLGKLRGLSEVMSVYRHNETGWTQKKRPKEAVIKIAESELHYSVFGEEYRPIGEGFYCLALVRAFVNTIYSRSTSIDTDYLRLAWNKSKSKTINSFFILIKKYIKKYFCI